MSRPTSRFDNSPGAAAAPTMRSRMFGNADASSQKPENPSGNAAASSLRPENPPGNAAAPTMRSRMFGNASGAAREPESTFGSTFSQNRPKSPSRTIVPISSVESDIAKQLQQAITFQSQLVKNIQENEATISRLSTQLNQMLPQPSASASAPAPPPSLAQDRPSSPITTVVARPKTTAVARPTSPSLLDQINQGISGFSLRQTPRQPTAEELREIKKEEEKRREEQEFKLLPLEEQQRILQLRQIQADNAKKEAEARRAAVQGLNWGSYIDEKGNKRWNSSSKEKYLKYKNKYYNLKNQIQ